MGKRKAITKKARFEVFKRDKFKCQYCGQSAPEVVLEIDHIIPVATGGDNDIMNLITACKGCNAGKKHYELTDDSVLAKQRRQLEDLQERKEQLELLAKWRQGLLQLDTETVNLVVKDIQAEYNDDYKVNDLGRKTIAKWLKQFPLNLILDCIPLANRYLEKDRKGKYTKESTELFFNKIPKIAYIRNLSEKDPHLGRGFYIKNVCAKKFGMKYWQLAGLENDIKHILDNGYTEDAIFTALNKCDYFVTFENTIAETIKKINK